MSTEYLPAQMRLRVKQGTDSPDIDIVAINLESFISQSIKKYDKGWKEHGGSILAKACLREARQEIIDLNFYLGAIEEKKKDVVSELANILSLIDNAPRMAEQRLKDLIKIMENL